MRSETFVMPPESVSWWFLMQQTRMTGQMRYLRTPACARWWKSPVWGSVTRKKWPISSESGLQRLNLAPESASSCFSSPIRSKPWMMLILWKKPAWTHFVTHCRALTGNMALYRAMVGIWKTQNRSVTPKMCWICISRPQISCISRLQTQFCPKKHFVSRKMQPMRTLSTSMVRISKLRPNWCRKWLHCLIQRSSTLLDMCRGIQSDEIAVSGQKMHGFGYNAGCGALFWPGIHWIWALDPTGSILVAFRHTETATACIW